MKIKDGFTLHQISDEYIIMYNGTQNVDFNNIISLNSTAAHLWKHVEGMDFNAYTLTDFLMENYEDRVGKGNFTLSLSQNRT